MWLISNVLLFKKQLKHIHDMHRKKMFYVSQSKAIGNYMEEN